MKFKTFLFVIFFAKIFYGYTQTDEVHKAMQQYRYREAIDLLQFLPETHENLLLKAKSYEKLYDYSSAITIYEKCLKEDSTNIDVLISLAEVTSQSGDADTSLKYWMRANELFPDHIFLRTQNAIAHYRVNDWAGTIESARMVFQTDSVPLLLRMTGDAFLFSSKADSAIWYYTKAIQHNPSDYLSVRKLGDIYYAMKFYDTAISLTEEYLSNINPDQKVIGQLNGMAHYAAENYDKAIERLKKNFELGDSTYTTNYFLGMGYYGSKLYFDATKWLDKAYRLDSTDINLLYYYGTALSRTYDRGKGIEILMQGMNKIEKLNEMLYDFDLSLADAYFRSGSAMKAINHYQSAYKQRPDKSLILYNIAQAYEMLNDPENAIIYYNRFLKTAPKETAKDNLPADQENLEKMSNIETLYHAAAHRINELKEEMFFKEGKK